MPPITVMLSESETSPGREYFYHAHATLPGDPSAKPQDDRTPPQVRRNFGKDRFAGV